MSLPTDKHAWVGIGGHHLHWAGSFLGGLNHVVKLSHDLRVEGVFHVLGLVQVVLLLLLPLTQELQVLLGVHGAKLVLLTHFEVFDVLLVEDLVAGIHLILVALLLAVVEFLELLLHILLVGICSVEAGTHFGLVLLSELIQVALYFPGLLGLQLHFGDLGQAGRVALFVTNLIELRVGLALVVVLVLQSVPVIVDSS